MWPCKKTFLTSRKEFFVYFPGENIGKFLPEMGGDFADSVSRMIPLLVKKKNSISICSFHHLLMPRLSTWLCICTRTVAPSLKEEDSSPTFPVVLPAACPNNANPPSRPSCAWSFKKNMICKTR